MQQLTGTIRAYAWGTTDQIPQLLHRPVTDEPQAEYWLGTHPSGPAVLDCGRELTDALAEEPTLVGEEPLAQFGPGLPYLLKVLSAARALSLQAHPSREQAVAGYAREEAAGVPRDAAHRNYSDDWPKPEAMVARTEFHGLCGFREPTETAELLRAWQVPGLARVVDPLESPGGADGVREAFLAALQADAELVRQVVAAAGQQVATPGPGADLAATALELAESFPDDPGIIAALLLNRIVLQPGEAFFMDAGNMHAYLRGTGIEVMANSDNVLRGGLTGKHVDIDELASVVSFAPERPEVIRPVEEAPGLSRYPTPAPEFALWRMDDPQATPLPAPRRGRIVLVTDGALELGVGEERIGVCSGEAVFVSALDDAEAPVTVSGTGTGFVAAPGV